nr:MAG TPA: hypothetical protein [Caudoviricetes sp.]
MVSPAVFPPALSSVVVGMIFPCMMFLLISPEN